MVKVMSLRLDDELYEDLETRAKRLKIPPSILARVLLAGALAGEVDQLLVKPALEEQRGTKPGNPARSKNPKKRR